MAFRFSVAGVSRKTFDGAITGATVAVKCENVEDGNVIGENILTWYAAKNLFPGWPPTKAQVRAYIVSHLLGKAEGSAITRAARMMQNADVPESHEVWDEAERELTIP